MTFRDELKSLESSREFMRFMRELHKNDVDCNLLDGTPFEILFTDGWCEDLARYFELQYGAEVYCNKYHYCFKLDGKYYDILNRDGVDEPEKLRFNTEVVANEDKWKKHTL